MLFEWDDNKREANRARHKLDLTDGEILFDGRRVISFPSPRDSEQRFVTTGRIGPKFYTVVWTERDEAIRLISFRRARAKKERIVRASANEIQAMRDQGKTRSDWAAAERMTQAEVERLAEEDDGPLPAGWESSVEIGLPEPAQPVNIRLDAAVLRWFKARGPGYQTRINAVLRAFVRARERTERPGEANESR